LGEFSRPPGSLRRAGATTAVLALIAVGASGCGGGLKNAVDTARSLQDQGRTAASQAQQQVQSVEQQFQQQQNQNGAGY
jgi:hypothetical protein